MRDSVKKIQIQSRQLTARYRKHPSLLVIGCGKCGTTSLYNYLIRHPDITAPFRKEIDYFNKHYEKPFDWYRAHFPLDYDRKVTIDVSPSIIYSKVAISRMIKQYPKIKYSVIVRDPIERSYSGYLMAKRNGHEHRDFDTAIRQEMSGVKGYPSYVKTSCYSEYLDLLFGFIKKDDLKLIDLGDLKIKPDETMSDLFRFIGLAPHHRKDYPTYNKRKETNKPDKKTIKLLKEYFKPYNERLEKLMGKKLEW